MVMVDEDWLRNCQQLALSTHHHRQMILLRVRHIRLPGRGNGDSGVEVQRRCGIDGGSAERCPNHR
jgi:hypothetical protein